jgi:cardiolipin synthase
VGILRKIIKNIFSQKALFILIMLMQILFLGSSIWFLSSHYAFVYGFLVILDILLVIDINKDKSNPAYKIMWIAIITVLPVFGGVTYIYTKSQLSLKIFSKNQAKKIQEIKQYLPQGKYEYKQLKLEDKKIANLSKYIYEYTNLPVYQNTLTEYYSLGEYWFESLKNECKKAKHYIFMEYFIITSGKLWDELSEILIQKAKEGVNIKILYDGIGTGFVTSKKLFRPLQAEGVEVKSFNSFRPFLSTVQNNRDHRKIAVIDGIIGFNGGTNLADEYINEIEKFGHWKDTAVMIKGEAAKSLSAMFLQLWEKEAISEDTFNKVLPANDVIYNTESKGFIQPYSDSPLDNENVGRMVYLDLINMAEKSICIMTPYLIPDNELLTALELAAKKGIDVKIITPHHPDKWFVYQIAWTYYETLIDYGVKIYEYLPGFIHAKSILIDDRIATVGTINFDYRSLYLHFECGVLLYKTDAVKQLKEDCEETLKRCIKISKKACFNRSIVKKFIGNILRLFAPLL